MQPYSVPRQGFVRGPVLGNPRVRAAATATASSAHQQTRPAKAANNSATLGAAGPTQTW